ncbi:MAG: DUF998 domain-containing protein [Acidobacteriota bacterium]
MKRKILKNNKRLVQSGFIIPIIFWGTTIISGLMTENYNHLRNLVSELGAMGTKTQYIFTTGLVLSSILSIFFVIGLYRSAKGTGLKTIPVLFILTFSFSIFGAAVFPLPLRLHGILGLPSMLLPLSPLLAMILWKTRTIPGVKLTSGIILLIMALGFSVLVPDVMDNYFGLKQRFFHLGWTLWFLYLAGIFTGLEKRP